MIGPRWMIPVLLIAFGTLATAQSAAKLAVDAAADRAERHQTAEWLSLAPHLPDPEAGTAQALETAADVMRARRMPEDALDYYHFALKRGGDEPTLDNRIGVTLLELRRPTEARAYFKRALLLKPKDAQEWNNLGAAEYVLGNYRAALEDYLRAVKLDRKTAVFHSNLGTAYFEVKDYDSARAQLQKAIRLDPNVFQGNGWAGVEAHVLSPTDHGRFCYEMAKLAAEQHDEAGMLRWLARSSEGGFDVQTPMSGDKAFYPYRKDPRIAVIVRNAKAMRSGQLADAKPVPPLPANAP